jgi:signal-transduction protein with cAMP-binding, CBS, and nucleotidyltransferase domain
MEKLEVLRRADVFQLLDEEELRELAEMCTEEVFEPGTIILSQSGPSEKLYIIAEGLVSINLEISPLDVRQIQAASNFQCIGWTSTIPPYKGLGTIKAIERTKVLAFHGKRLRALVYTKPALTAKIAGGIAQVISGRLRKAYEQCLGVTYED